MKKFIYKSVLVVVFLLMNISNVKAFDGEVKSRYSLMSGPTSVYINDIKTYNISNTILVMNATWSISGGVIQSQSSYSATIKWTTSGVKTIHYVAYTPQGIQEVFYNVTVNNGQTPNTPLLPTISTQNCTSAVIQKTGTVPLGVMWYWQGQNNLGTNTKFGTSGESPDA